MKSLVGNQERYMRATFNQEKYMKANFQNANSLHRANSTLSLSCNKNFDKPHSIQRASSVLFKASSTSNLHRSTSDSSKEYFTLQFYDEDEKVFDSEKVPVRKGRSLRDSIESSFVKRELDFNQYSVFLDSSKTPLPLLFDTFPLGGNTLHVKANQAMQVDERIITLMKAGNDDKTQNQRPKKTLSVLNESYDANSANKANSLPGNNNSKLSRKSGIFSSSKDITRNLSDILLHYSTHGFQLDSDNTDNVDIVEPLDELLLEESWTDVIDESEDMTHKHKIQQEALWELLITERNYIRKLKVIIEVFQKCLVNLQSENFLTEIDNTRLFSNINLVYETNSHFWNEFLSQIIEETRKSKEPIKPRQLSGSFAKFEELFEPYMKYCFEESCCVKYLKHLKRTNETFEEYLAWCENHQQCMRLKLSDLLVKPMQRVTKYGLLLKAILSKTLDQDDVSSLELMISQVERFVTKINTTLRKRHEQQKLENVLSRFELYSPIEAPNEEVERILLDYSALELASAVRGLPHDEQRCILLDGPMRLIEKQGRIEVHAFLFTDCFVIAKPRKNSDKFRIIRQPYRLNKIVLHPLKDTGSFLFVYLNEYNVLVTAFTLLVSANEHVKWKENIDKAKSRFQRARAANGSTLDFFDDDAPSFLNAPSHFTPNISPLPERRSQVISESLRLNSSSESQPSIVVTDDLNLKNRSTIPRVSSQRQLNIAEAAVKRSLSDPRNSWSRDPNHKEKKRPVSLITTSDHDTASWVLKNEKRERSGSIPSDISIDSRRSSGIGDSFRSINSDSAGAPSKDIPIFGNLSDVSNVAKLKARFEAQRCQSPSTEGSNSSLSTVSLPTASSDLLNTSANRRTTPPEYDQPSTIQEEEEHSSNHSYDKMSENSTPRPEQGRSSQASSESLRTLNGTETSCDVSVSTYKHINQGAQTTNMCTQTDGVILFSDDDIRITSELKQYTDTGIQCNNEPMVEHDGHNLSIRSNDVSLSNTNSSPLVFITDEERNEQTFLNISIDQNGESTVDNIYENGSTDVYHKSPANDTNEIESTDVNFESRVNVIVENESTGIESEHEVNYNQVQEPTDVNMESHLNHNNDNESTGVDSNYCSEREPTSVANEENNRNNEHRDISTQYECLLQSDISTQCEINEVRDVSIQCGDFIQLTGQSNIGRSSTQFVEHVPLTDLAANKLAKQKLRSNSYNNGKPRSILKQSLSDVNLPLIENVTEVRHERSRSDETSQSSQPSSPKPSHRNSTPSNDSPEIRSLQTLSESSESSLRNRTRSPSLEQNSDSHSVQWNEVMSSQSIENENELKPDLVRAQSVSKSANNVSHDDSKRFTWHDFDSIEALKRIQLTKYSVEGSPKSHVDSRKLDKSMSKSSNHIDGFGTPHKQRSFKKTILKKFSDKNRFERALSTGNVEQTTDSPPSSPDEKYIKKLKEKEKKKQKKEQKIRDKEEKKREKESKRHSNSFSSAENVSKDKKWRSTTNIIQEVPS